MQWQIDTTVKRLKLNFVFILNWSRETQLIKIKFELSKRFFPYQKAAGL